MPRAKKMPKNPRYSEVGEKTIDRIERSRTFEPWDKPQIGCRFHIFKKRGESIEGILGQPITNFHRNSSYPIELDSGETVEVFANKLLHRLIQKNELVCKRVKIVYIGRQYTGYGHARKIYRVYKIEGIISKSIKTKIGDTKNG
jgi:hypothetical protein